MFPFFLFIVGVSIALGVAPRLEAGADAGKLRRSIATRAARIIALGLLLHLLACWLLDKPWFRSWGVLQRIGLCFLVAGWLATWLRPRAQWLLIAAVLLGYWALLVATCGVVPWSNIASRLDTALFAPLLYQFDPATGLGHDPEGLLTTLPTIATALPGLRVGDCLRKGAAARLPVIALALLVSGGAWSLVLPFNKNLWTPSYVLWTGGWAMLALWLAHRLVDIRGWSPLGRSFGVNAIAAYVGSGVMVYVFAGLGWWAPIYQAGFAGWMAPRFGPYLPSLAFAVAFVAFRWLVVREMDRRGWYLKV